MTLKGTVGTSLMNLFKPVLVMVNNAIVVINQFAKAVGDSLGKILGWRYEVGSGAVALDDAADYAEDLEGGLGGAGKAAKDLKRQLQGFDELNNLTSNDPSGGGGGGGSGSGTSGAGGASDLAGRWVKEESLFESEWDTWFKLGRGISEAWTEGLNSIPWDSVYEKARDFGRNFASFLNGLITPELFAAVGQTIAGSLNTAIYAALTFGETLDWKQMGDSIAAGINKFFETFDFVATAQAINAWSKGILDMLITAVDQTDWTQMGEKIGSFFKELDIKDIVGKMMTLAGKILSALGDAFIALVETDPLSAGIMAVIVGAKLSGLTNKLNPLGSNISSAIGTSIKNNSDPISNALGKVFSVTGAVFAVVKAAIYGWTIGNIIGKIFEEEIERGIENVHTTIKWMDDVLSGGTEKKLAEWKQMFESGQNAGIIPDNDTLSKVFGGNNIFDTVKNLSEAGSKSTFNSSYFENTKKGYEELKKVQEQMYKDYYQIQKDGETKQLKLQQYNENKKKNSLKGYTSYAQTQIAKMQEQNAKSFATGASTSLALAKSFGKEFQEEHKVMTGGASQYWDNMAGTNIAIDRQTCQNIISNNRNFSRDFISNMAGMSTESTNKVTTMKTAVGTLINTMQTKGTTDVTTLANAIKTQTGSANTTSQTNANAMKSNFITNLGTMNTSTSTNTATMLKTIQTWSTNAKSTVANTKANANFGVKYEALSTVQNAINKLKGAWTDKSATFSIHANTTVGNINSIANDILGKIKSSFSGSFSSVLKSAANSIRFFATGGVAENATLGVFGEAGAEAIVPLERNTKWLGKMSNMLAEELAYKHYSPQTYSAPKYTGSTSIVAQTSERSEQATAEQNALLREEVELLRQIAGKEFSVSSRDVFNSMQSESENYYNRTGSNPFIF